MKANGHGRYKSKIQTRLLIEIGLVFFSTQINHIHLLNSGVFFQIILHNNFKESKNHGLFVHYCY